MQCTIHSVSIHYALYIYTLYTLYTIYTIYTVPNTIYTVHNNMLSSKLYTFKYGMFCLNSAPVGRMDKLNSEDLAE